jgi:hypothetical protein
MCCKAWGKPNSPGYFSGSRRRRKSKLSAAAGRALGEFPDGRIYVVGNARFDASPHDPGCFFLYRHHNRLAKNGQAENRWR